MLVVAAICFLRIALVHDAYTAPRSIESVVMLAVLMIYVTHSLITTKIKKDKDKVKKL